MDGCGWHCCSFRVDTRQDDYGEINNFFNFDHFQEAGCYLVGTVHLKK
jgi:hypothetical protein